MLKVLFTCGFILFVCSVGISYASIGRESKCLNSECKKQVYKISEGLIDKLPQLKPSYGSKLKPAAIQPVSVKSTPAAADTFESLITPFLKTVAPVFYDKIIRKEPKPTALPS
ncbi:MAG TPA: hypothetical protein VF602_05100 [Pedobacter sp.]|jgi:hypothetical protein